MSARYRSPALRGRSRVAAPGALPRADWARGLGAAALTVSGGIHLAVAVPHAEEALLLGLGMALVGVAQLAVAALVMMRADPRTALTVGAVISLAALVVYVMSRTGDLPFMPVHTAHEGAELPVVGAVGDGMPVLPGSRTEEVGPLDATCAGAELVALGAAYALVRRRTADTLTLLCVLAVLSTVGWRLVG